MAFSRRDFLASSAVALGAGLMANPRLARAWQQQAPPLTPVFTDIRRGVGFFTCRGGTIGYLVNANGVVAVDSQYADSGKLCVDGLNERSKNRPVDFLINTHHHGDHTAGNIAFKGVAKKVVAHVKADEHMRMPPGRPAPTAENLYPDTTFTEAWKASVGDETISAKYYGRAHTSGDAVITFERANVAHMGDLMFNRRHPVIDRPAGTSLANWAAIMEKVPGDHSADTIYIFGHAGPTFPVTGDRKELAYFRDYVTALLEFVRAEVKADKTREQIAAVRDPLKGFEAHGPLTAAVLGGTYDEVTEGPK